MRWYSTEARTRKYVKGYRFWSFARKYKKQLTDTGLDAVKVTSKKVAHKAASFMENKIANAVTRQTSIKCWSKNLLKK